MKRALILLSLAAFTASASAQWSNPQEEVPAYNAAPPKPGQKLPSIMSGKDIAAFQASPQQRVYKLAAKIPAVLHQLPCYCHCDRSAGHNSLHSCFEGQHGAYCDVCMKEAVFAYQQTKAGKTAKQIRAEIIKGQWQSVDLSNVPVVN